MIANGLNIGPADSPLAFSDQPSAKETAKMGHAFHHWSGKQLFASQLHSQQ
jgi:hypothetical protein